MKKTPPAKPPEPTPTESPSGKVSKDKKFERAGQRIKELEKEYAELPSRTRHEIADFITAREIPISPEDLADLVTLTTSGKVEAILAEVHGYVEEDQTYPVSAKYLGRALKDMKAVGSPGKAKSRIEIMAFFHTGLAGSTIRAPKAGERDYLETAKECFEYIANIVNENTESTNASKGLEKPIRILEALNLADARLAKTKGRNDGEAKEKRDGTYLRDFGGVVFDGWPLWPGEA